MAWDISFWKVADMFRNSRIPLYAKLLASNGIILLTLIAVMLIGREVISDRFEDLFTERFEAQIDRLEEVVSNHLSSGEVYSKQMNRMVYGQFNERTYIFKVYDEQGVLMLDSRDWVEPKKLPERYPYNKFPAGFNGGEGSKKENSNEERDNRVKAVTVTRELYDSSGDGDDFLGELEVTYYMFDNFLLEDAHINETFFALYRIMMLAVAVIAVLMSIVISRSITKPIQKVIVTTNSMQDGDFKQRVDVKTNTRELLELKDSINYLADTLEEEDTLRRQLTSDMAHEIRTPVNNVQNILEALIDGVWERSDENLENCYQEVIRLSSLVDKLKSIATIEEDNLVIHNAEFDAAAVTGETLELFDVEASKRELTIEYASDEDLIVYMDKDKYNQILCNLVSNSIKYAYEGTTITVSLKKGSGGILRLAVRDRGIGIGEEHLKRIFERFYRTDESRNKETGGMGLGLTITRKIVSMYNGEIVVHSKEAEGTVFEVELPVLK